MPSFCAVLNCNDRYGHGHGADCISFHKFPFKRKELLEKWFAFTERGNEWKPSRWSAICSRHFAEQDFNCINERKTLKKTAVPTIRTTDRSGVTVPVVQQRIEISDDGSSPQKDATNKQPEKAILTANVTTKMNCRLCGCASISVVSFATNFEIYGMIQKCFPTLNIHQNADDDADNFLPKEMCRTCLKRVEGFSRFIDQVCETQAELLRRFRPIEGSTTPARPQGSTSERPSAPSQSTLKIKQEPVVRVKQEVAEVFDKFPIPEELDIMAGEEERDMTTIGSETIGGIGGVDLGGCEVDQKYQFCDFPMLNTQDIVNNCDIMEIINLDDPFIDIPDDDGIGTAHNDSDGDYVNRSQQMQHTKGSQQHQQQQQQHQPSAYDLLQTHLLIEEHNYAYAAAYDFKEEEQQLRSCYKTEKTEDYEQQKQSRQFSQGDEPSSSLRNNNKNIEVFTYFSQMPSNEANDKPIVTSIASVAARATPAIPILPADQCKTLTPPADQEQYSSNRSHAKPNVVVLNESIVQSSSAFHLNACTVCHMQFITGESLLQHLTQTHIIPKLACTEQNETAITKRDDNIPAPMVSVPSVNIIPTLPPSDSAQIENLQYGCKVEPETYLSKPSDQSRMEQPPIRNRIDILEMQQTFGAIYSPPQPLLHPPTMSAIDQSINSCKQAKTTSAPPSITTVLHTAKPRQKLATVTANFKHLQQRYRQLQRKCQSLQSTNRSAQAHASQMVTCVLCGRRFRGIFALLAHKQRNASTHHIRKPHSPFGASCSGCERFFRSKLALRNHMRFICQALPLRWSKIHLQMFKCRHCRRISFTHWRLCRRHELHCRQKRLQKRHSKLRSPNKMRRSEANVKRNTTRAVIENNSAQIISSKELSSRKTFTGGRNGNGYHRCRVCDKTFKRAFCLSQHEITHTEGRQHKCTLCARRFKRRNGLTQHMRGYHLQLKPFECPTCQHRYALKCDMQRCRHSMRNATSTLKSCSTIDKSTRELVE